MLNYSDSELEFNGVPFVSYTNFKYGFIQHMETLRRYKWQRTPEKQK